ncbi:unnamed protein product [Orchesella dallaii]|uniref:C2H2-type domain-containing protein n=1 Tax=Orchesella dallaii TaxID=48710 RepID=A0ABP1RWR7_9HEXA
METLPTFSFIKQEVLETSDYVSTRLASNHLLENQDQNQNTHENGTDNSDSSSQLQKKEIERPFQCIFCYKAFLSNAALYAHLHAHTREKPYLCGYCEKSFSLKYSLQVHSVLHKKALPFQCQMCHKDYPSKHRLKQHYFQVHSIGTMLKNNSRMGKTLENYKPAKCNICFRTYANSYTLKTHLKTHERVIKQEEFNNTQCDNEYFSEGELHANNSLDHLETGVHWNTTDYTIIIKKEVEGDWAESTD